MFRKRKPAKQLSAEELKSKLYAHFDKTGSLNQMRTEIRGKLVHELFKMSPPPVTSEVEHLTTDFDKTLLPLQVCNWLVYDHLLRQGYQYALSTFVTEANVPHPERLLTASDILGLFRLDSSTTEYKSISKMYSANNEQGFLHSLLLAVIKSLFDFPPEENMNQSMNVQDASMSLKEASGDGALFDSSEIPKFARESFARPRNKSTDSSFQEQLQLIKEEKEKEVQVLRQKWLQELDRLHTQERSLKEEIESKRKEVQRELDEILVQKEKSKEREFFLIKEYENKLEKKIRDLETDHMSKIHSKESDLKIFQGKLYDKELRIAQVEADFASLQTNYHSLKRELEEVKDTYKLTKEKYSTLLDENTKLLRKFENMSDYTILKGDLETQCKTISSLRQELDENKRSSEKEKDMLFEKMRSLETKLKHKESQLSEAQRQLNLCRDTMHREEAIWHKERRKLEQDSQESKEMYKTLIQRLEEQRDDIQALHHTIHILHYQLTDTDKRNSTKPDTFVPQRTEIKFSDKKETAIFRLSNNNPKISSKHTDDSLKFIEEAKGRIKSLEKEANTLRDKCSAVFCHGPSLQDMHGHDANVNPSVFNSGSVSTLPIKTFPSQSYNKSFETLIRNEMPTLDSCLQMQGKSQLISTSTDLQFLKTTDSNVHSSDIFKSTALDVSKTMPFSYLSSLNLYQQDFVPKYANNPHDNPKVSVLQSKEKSERPSIQKPAISNDSSAKITQHNSESIQKPTNTQSELANVTLTENTVHLTKATEKNMTNTTLSNLKSNIDASPLDVSAQTAVDNISSDFNTIQSRINIGQDEKESNETTSLVDDNISQKTESPLKSDSALKADPPIVVDLDSAWKRKTSLKDNSNFQTVPSILSGLDSAWKRRTSLMTSTPLFLSSGSSIQIEEENGNDTKKGMVLEREFVSNEKDADNSESKMDFPVHITNDVEIVQTDSENVDSIKSNERVQNLMQESKVPSLAEDEIENNETKPSSLENSEHAEQKIDPIIEKQDKPIPEDSLSEPSDMHLSCGSEQEQQKEDSDNW